MSSIVVLSPPEVVLRFHGLCGVLFFSLFCFRVWGASAVGEMLLAARVRL